MLCTSDPAFRVGGREGEVKVDWIPLPFLYMSDTALKQRTLREGGQRDKDVFHWLLPRPVTQERETFPLFSLGLSQCLAIFLSGSTYF